MRFINLLILAPLAVLAHESQEHAMPPSGAITAPDAVHSAECVSAPSLESRNITMPVSPDLAPALPTKFGMLLFPSFQALDVFGPLDVLNTLSWSHPELTLSMISKDLNPVSTLAKKFNSTFAESVTPTHTFDTAPEDIEVLLVPGGVGTRSPDLQPEIAFIAKTFPNLKYLITICTGAALAVEAGVLAGEIATTNKMSFDWVTERPGGTEVEWIRQARWVEGRNGKVWTTSGISAGIDGTFAWVAKVYGEEVAAKLAKSMEYSRRLDWQDDEFAVEEKTGTNGTATVGAPVEVTSVPSTMPVEGSVEAPVEQASAAPVYSDGAWVDDSASGQWTPEKAVEAPAAPASYRRRRWARV